MSATKSVFDMYNVRVEMKDEKGNWKPLLTGTVDKYSKDAKKYAEKGEVIISDAITPKRNRVPVKHDLIRFIELDFAEADKYLNDALEEAQKKSNSIKGLAAGKLFSVPVADGCAYYVVTRVNKKSVRIEWRGFHPDRWTDQVLGAGGSFPREHIERLVRGADSLRALFGGSKDEFVPKSGIK